MVVDEEREVTAALVEIGAASSDPVMVVLISGYVREPMEEEAYDRGEDRLSKEPVAGDKESIGVVPGNGSPWGNRFGICGTVILCICRTNIWVSCWTVSCNCCCCFCNSCI